MTTHSKRKRFLHALANAAWQQPLWAIPFALFFGTLSGGSFDSYWISYKASLVFAYCIRLALLPVTAWYIPGVHGREIGGHPPGIVRIVLALAVAVLIGSYVGATIIHFAVIPGFMGSPRAILVSGMFTLLFFGLFTGFNLARVYYRQAVDRARAVEQMRAELAQAELRALRAQINPHFLFNTLNSIAALIAMDPAAAEDTTTRLADVFRYSLRASEREHARLEDELAFLRSYLEIERTRFGERLAVEEAIEPGLASLMVPSLILQPLVENAVRYAVSPRLEGGRIRIGARREGDSLVLEVVDDGPGMNGDEPPTGTGFGLHSVRERLRAAGHRQALAIDSAPGGGTRIRITLPATSSLQETPIPSPQDTPTIGGSS